jgi:hypothetical protein
MRDSTTSPVEAGPTRPAPRGPAFQPFAPRLEPFEPGVFDGEPPDGDPTETMDRPDDEDDGRAGPS